MGFRMELVHGSTPICEGSCHLTSLERQEVWNDCRSCKVRVVSNGNLFWEASVLLGRKKGCTGMTYPRLFLRCVMDKLKFTAMPFGLTNAPAIFMELISRMIVESLKEDKMYMKFSNNVEVEQRGSYLDVEGIKWGEGDCLYVATTEGSYEGLQWELDFEAKYIGSYVGRCTWRGRRSEARMSFRCIDVR
ncbi:hypothetical protein Tco_0238015 [Tanacetum coccineum]